MSYHADKLVIDTHTHTDTQTHRRRRWQYPKASGKNYGRESVNGALPCRLPARSGYDNTPEPLRAAG